MKFLVRVTQTLEGVVEIEASSREAALDIAGKRFVDNGDRLPDMEDLTDLDFDILDTAKKEMEE